LYSLLASQRACHDEICSLDEQFRQLTGITTAEETHPPEAAALTVYGKTIAWARKFADLFSPRATVFGTIVRVLNRLAGLFFFLGIVFFAVFAKENWTTMKPAKDESAPPAASSVSTAGHGPSAHANQPIVQSPITNTASIRPPTMTNTGSTTTRSTTGGRADGN
jgi:hypothetical protein